MNCENRASLVDGTVEGVCFKEVDLSKLPKSDPFMGIILKREKRACLIDGTVEEIDIEVLPPLSIRGVIKGKKGEK